MFDRLDELERAIDKVTASEHELDLPRLRKLVDRLEAAWLHALQTRGDVEPGWLAGNARMPLHEARADVRTAQRIGALVEFRDALLEGEFTPAHAHVVGRACTPKRAGAFAEIQPRLIDGAQRLPVRHFAGLVKHICDAIEGDDGAAAANEAHDAREVYMAKSWRGMGFLHGQLDPEGAEYVITALETRMEDDKDLSGERRRSRPQRRADALVDIAATTSTHANTKTTIAAAAVPMSVCSTG